jgi:hypothetical protein
MDPKGGIYRHEWNDLFLFMDVDIEHFKWIKSIRDKSYVIKFSFDLEEDQFYEGFSFRCRSKEEEVEVSVELTYVNDRQFDQGYSVKSNIYYDGNKRTKDDVILSLKDIMSSCPYKDIEIDLIDTDDGHDRLVASLARDMLNSMGNDSEDNLDTLYDIGPSDEELYGQVFVPMLRRTSEIPTEYREEQNAHEDPAPSEPTESVGDSISKSFNRFFQYLSRREQNEE